MTNTKTALHAILDITNVSTNVKTDYRVLNAIGELADHLEAQDKHINTLFHMQELDAEHSRVQFDALYYRIAKLENDLPQAVKIIRDIKANETNLKRNEPLAMYDFVSVKLDEDRLDKVYTKTLVDLNRRLDVLETERDNTRKAYLGKGSFVGPYKDLRDLTEKVERIEKSLKYFFDGFAKLTAKKLEGTK